MCACVRDRDACVTVCVWPMCVVWLCECDRDVCVHVSTMCVCVADACAFVHVPDVCMCVTVTYVTACVWLCVCVAPVRV